MNRSNVWMCVCLASLISGCASREPVATTEYVNVYLPDSQLVDCPITESVDGGTFRQMGTLAAARKVDTENCNARLAGLRDFQAKARAEEAAAKGVTP